MWKYWNICKKNKKQCIKVEIISNKTLPKNKNNKHTGRQKGQEPGRWGASHGAGPPRPLLPGGSVCSHVPAKAPRRQPGPRAPGLGPRPAAPGRGRLLQSNTRCLCKERRWMPGRCVRDSASASVLSVPEFGSRYRRQYLHESIMANISLWKISLDCVAMIYELFILKGLTFAMHYTPKQILSAEYFESYDII